MIETQPADLREAATVAAKPQVSLLTAAELADATLQACDVLADRLTVRLDAARKLAGSEHAAVTGPGVSIGYLLASDIVKGLKAARDTIATLRDSQAEAARERDKAQAILDGRMEDLTRLHLEELHIQRDRGLEMSMRSGAIGILAAFMAAEFKRAGAENYYTIELTAPDIGPLLLTMQRQYGDHPAQVAARERARAVAAEEDRDRWKERAEAGERPDAR